LSRRLAYRALLLLAGSAVLGLLIMWLLPALLTRHPAHGMTAAERLKAVNDVRTPLVGFVVLLGSAATVWFTARTHRLGREGQVTDRYTRAVGQLGDAKTPVRVGGVYALERIGHDSPRDRDTIIFVLGAFVREQSRETRKRQDVPPEDVRAALRVAGRLLASSATQLDLRDANLRNTDLSNIPAARVMLDGADLTDSSPPRV
jgi:hypothetical protein